MRNLIIFLFVIFTLNSNSQIKNGYYFSKIPIKNKWNSNCFYEEVLIIRNDSVYLEIASFCIVKKDTCNAAANYSGSKNIGFISTNGKKIYISIYLIDCDYCLLEVPSDSTYVSLRMKTYRLYIKGDYLIFNNHRYKYFPEKSKVFNEMDFKNLFKQKYYEPVGVFDEPNEIIED
jgi:hypothetical protein